MIEVIVLMIYYAILGAFGIVLNGLLLLLAIFRSPSQIKTYRILIINFALTDMFSSFLMMFCAPRIIPLDYAMAHIFYGLCHFGHPFLCYASWSALLHLFIHSMWSLLLSFAYRNYILSSAPPSTWKVFMFSVFIYIPSFTQFIVLMFTAADPYLIFGMLKSKFPDYTFEISTVTGISDALSPAATFSILNMTVPVFAIYTAILVFRRKILCRLGKNTENLRSETKSIHKQLLRALTLQACLPVLFVGGVFCFFIQAIRLITHPIFECLICAIPAPIPLLSSIISLYHIRPYRREILRIFTRVTIPIPQIEPASSAVALAAKHKISVLSMGRLHRLSVPNNS
ncbi:G_PROTEIN_RECEP_F1_2 domain-containing protein [Caenorhabditis elegans]|uniref:G_PROTEIN_RECEP_F1_2 domain-containing protein n=1 Tax=Caenorhabditis elegans TaxID=6239 RepID=Q9GS01_CAEEL|nr:G_PROTEIN_RECEP_F1_2 domain-containing protein [Caenorhabditis elegans]CCD64168.1 G_PROTEIN_RECEP_F1_2 domain-containing protein [Caenorhabditis elegans]|eukprot:NP_504426.1 Serpentine Receptor, class D (delta) [Caenorhabditis elegans]